MKILKYALGPMQTNCYFLIDEETKKTMVVDPACDCEGILEKLERHELKVEAILLTHAHFDHMLALEELREKTGAPLLVHKDEAEALKDPKISLMEVYADITEGCREPERLLEEGDVIKLGNTELAVLHTPGHTKGSICLISGETMISGDTLFYECVGRYDFPGGDYGTLIKSLERLMALETDYKVYPGHGNPTTISHEREFNPFIH